METVLSIFCILLGVLVLILLWKIYVLRKAADELREEFAARLQEDTNVGMDISTSDKKMRTLAADMDRQIKQLRKEHLRYEQGDAELKNAVTINEEYNIVYLEQLIAELELLCEYIAKEKKEAEKKENKSAEIFNEKNAA